ncbi:MAG: acetyl/propionyl/methylcrotonyl-CoA carboxylase subunit alpha [Chloroflexota bacterium]|nr:acetyl/propionyl/methylcrotonyl-CoA carboxylase subunit alpha [Chloroflexota bacterium]
MFKKILIANRGEIACRIMATCRQMGIRTVAIYSEADRFARHMREADEAYAVGPAPAAQSYLRIEAIIDVATRSGAQAIHPGYGFLSENTAFVEACEQANITFIGPPAAAMRLMGSKIAAKQLAESVGAPTIPGYNGASQDDAVLAQEARRIGFPLLIKASAGGGGKGMREVHSEADFLMQLAGARREALAAFGDGTVFLERLLQQPRHVEIQVLGDRAGNLIHLGERECSIQRRHQKIVEESPSVALTPALRAEMGEAAVRIARTAGYVNAGTLEFMLDQDRRFYFLEMNTRLQVEHPVTELVTGIDLVRHQILIAAGESLSLTQEQISPRGHAIEMRLYAEDPDQDFLPSTGSITRFVKPEGPGIRVDSGIDSGDEITQYYDPMIAKLIVYGEDRPAAIARMRATLEQTIVFGVRTNAPLLHAIAMHPAFEEGYTHTNFLNEQRLLDRRNEQPYNQRLQDALMAAGLHALDDALSPANSLSANPWKTLGPWRMLGEAHTVTYRYQEQEHHVALRLGLASAGTWNVQVDSQPAEDVTYQDGNDDLILLRRGAGQVRAYVQQIEGQTQVVLDGLIYRLERRQPPNVDAAAHGGSAVQAQRTLNAPMAGTVVKVLVADGAQVQHQQVLVILSAMKMEHTITAPADGIVRRVHYKEGDVVKGGAVVVEME